MTGSCTDLAEVTLIPAGWLALGSTVRPLLAALVTALWNLLSLLAENACRDAGAHRRFIRPHGICAAPGDQAGGDPAPSVAVARQPSRGRADDALGTGNLCAS